MTQVMPSSNVLDLARRLLDDGRPQQALDLLSHSKNASQAAENLRAVCLMRLGKPQEALNVLRPVLFPHGIIAIDSDVPVTHRTNYATALLLAGSIVPGLEVLSGIHEHDHPAVARLRAAVRGWKKQLSALDRLLFCVGRLPSRALTLGFPPGDP